MPGWSWPEVIAHRCGGALAPENTLAGLAIAARLGCRAVVAATPLVVEIPRYTINMAREGKH